MIDEFTVNKKSVGFFEDRRSEFTAILTPTLSLDEFKMFIDSLRAEHKEMCHFCSAVRLRTTILTEKASDDGEPSGTAGRPILQSLQRKNLMNCGIVVYRKYGGTKLGTGGLVRAYGGSARLAIENAIIGRMLELKGIFLSVDYSLWAKLEGDIKNFDSNPEVEFAGKVDISLFVEPDKLENFEEIIREKTAGKIKLEKRQNKLKFKANKRSE